MSEQEYPDFQSILLFIFHPVTGHACVSGVQILQTGGVHSLFCRLILSPPLCALHNAVKPPFSISLPFQGVKVTYTAPAILGDRIGEPLIS
jgi:hypothetical protein